MRAVGMRHKRELRTLAGSHPLQCTRGPAYVGQRAAKIAHLHHAGGALNILAHAGARGGERDGETGARLACAAAPR